MMPATAPAPSFSIADDFEVDATEVERAAILSASTMDHFMALIDIAGVDPDTATTLLAAELLAVLHVHGGTDPEDWLLDYRRIIDRRADALRAALHEVPPPAPVQNPARSTAAPRTIH